MLKVSIYAGASDRASRFNLLAWLDIGYEKLAPEADYTTLVFQSGSGAGLPTTISPTPVGPLACGA